MTLFHGLLNMAAINACIIGRANENVTIKRTEFNPNLGLSIIYEHLYSRKLRRNIPSYHRQQIEKLEHATFICENCADFDSSV